MVVGWYHSHPGFGCWLSGVDINTQQVRAPGSQYANACRSISCCGQRLQRVHLGLAGCTVLLANDLTSNSMNASFVACMTARVAIAVTTQSFEALNQRAVAVVVDPVQSVKGKVVIDAFRLISPQTMMLGQEPRQTTSNLGHLNKPSIQACLAPLPL